MPEAVDVLPYADDVLVQMIVQRYPEGATMEIVAAVFGITKQRVDQIQAQALRKIEHRLDRSDREAFAEVMAGKRRWDPTERAEAGDRMRWAAQQDGRRDKLLRVEEEPPVHEPMLAALEEAAARASSAARYAQAVEIVQRWWQRRTEMAA